MNGTIIGIDQMCDGVKDCDRPDETTYTCGQKTKDCEEEEVEEAAKKKSFPSKNLAIVVHMAAQAFLLNFSSQQRSS